MREREHSKEGGEGDGVLGEQWFKSQQGKKNFVCNFFFHPLDIRW
jgi:hypothetical protein